MIRLLAIFTLFVSAAAHGAEFTSVLPGQSTVTFVSKQMNVPVEGAFRKFSAQIAMDPARPEAGRARIEIELAGIDVGSEEANDEVKGKNWFDVRDFPRASFVSSSVRAIGGNRFEVGGKMTIRGRTLDARAAFTLKQEKGLLVLDGSFPLKRLDYGIGSGEWGDTSVVADEVRVKFHFVLK